MSKNHKIIWVRNALAVGLTCLLGCQQMGPSGRRTPSLLDRGGPATPITSAQEADMQIALGRTAEAQGNLDQARAAYQAALGRDKKRADAHQRLAVLHDKQGQFRESADLYRQAIATDPGNPEIYCDMGYSLYLQRRWAEAEMNLKQALALSPDDRRAHNNLGMVLAHNARADEAVAEFRKGGSTEAEARENVAFARTTEKDWAGAQRQYRLALRAQPGSKVAEARLREIDTLVAKVDKPKGPVAPVDRKLIATSGTSPAPAAVRPPAPAAVRPPAPVARPVPKTQTTWEAMTAPAAPAARPVPKTQGATTELSPK
jgi:tetratricopeptide (TPR) repeat protein